MLDSKIELNFFIMEKVETYKIYKAVGPYSQAVKTGKLLFCSGQLPLMSDGQMVSGGIKEQTKQVLENLKAVLLMGGSDLDKVVKTTVYIVDMVDFSAMNEVYGSYFNSYVKPARATVQVAALAKEALVEIDCVAEV